jgi:hypothetical protein
MKIYEIALSIGAAIVFLFARIGAKKRAEKAAA